MPGSQLVQYRNFVTGCSHFEECLKMFRGWSWFIFQSHFGIYFEEPKLNRNIILRQPLWSLPFLASRKQCWKSLQWFSMKGRSKQHCIKVESKCTISRGILRKGHKKTIHLLSFVSFLRTRVFRSKQVIAARSMNKAAGSTIQTTYFVMTSELVSLLRVDIDVPGLVDAENRTEQYKITSNLILLNDYFSICSGFCVFLF